VAISDGSNVDAAASNAAFVSKTVNNSIAGEKTFTGRVIHPSATTITAFSGGGQGSATLLTKDQNFVTTVAATNDSVKLPVAKGGGDRLLIFNLGANILAVFPNTGGEIDAEGANNSVTIAAGSSKIFVSDALLSWESDSFGGGGAAGASTGINYITNSDAETDTTGWATYADVAGATPVDGTGGSPTTTLARNTTTPLRETGDFKLVKDAADRQGEGVSFDFTTDEFDKNKVLSISFDFDATDTDFTEDDIRVFIFDKDNSQLITVDPDDGLKPHQGTFQGTFQGTSADDYRLIIHIATTNALAYDVFFDNVKVGPQDIVFGPAMTDIRGFTPTITMQTSGTVTLNATPSKAFWKRSGDTIEVWWHGEITSVSSPLGNMIFNLPDNLSADTTKISNADTDAQIIGSGFMDDATASKIGVAVRLENSDGAIEIVDANTGTAIPTPAASDIIAIHFKVPILNWSTNVVNSEAKTFKISNFLVNGTRVTGGAPTTLGEFRSQLRNASAVSYTDTNGSPIPLPNTSDGVNLFGGNGWASADTNNQPSRYDIFVGKGKFVKFEFFANAGRTGIVTTDLFHKSAFNNMQGSLAFYDPTTGVATVHVGVNSAATNANGVGFSDGGETDVQDAFFDITVSDNALTVQQDALNSMIRMGTNNGFGSVNDKIRRYLNIVVQQGGDITLTQSATDGDSFLINKTGMYGLSLSDTASAASSIGLSLNSTQLTTDIVSITEADRLAIGAASGADVQQNVAWMGFLQIGDVVRVHSQGTSGGTASKGNFTISRLA